MNVSGGPWSQAVLWEVPEKVVSAIGRSGQVAGGLEPWGCGAATEREVRIPGRPGKRAGRRGTRARSSGALPGGRERWPRGGGSRRCGASAGPPPRGAHASPATESAPVPKPGRAGAGWKGGSRERPGARRGAAPRALRGPQAPRSAASEEARGLPAAAAPHALPRCEPRRSRGPAAAAGRLVPGSVRGPGSTPGGHPRSPRRSAGALGDFNSPRRRAKPVLLGELREWKDWERRGENGGGEMGAGPALGRGVKRLLSFSPREFSRKASLSRLRKPGSLKATAEPSPAPRHCCQELASPSALGSLGGRGQPPQGQLWVEGLPGRGHCWGAERQVPRASTLDTACPHCHPTEGPRWQGVPLKPDSPGRRGLMPWDRCGDRAGMRQAFHIRLAGQGDPPPP